MKTLSLVAAICCLSVSMSFADIIYVDGDHSSGTSSNLFLAADDSSISSTNLGGWDPRGLGAAPLGSADAFNFGNEGGTFQSTVIGQADTFYQTVTGLDANCSYDIYTFYWVGPLGQDWNVAAGFTANDLTLHDRNTGTLVDATTAPGITGLNVLGQDTDDFSDFEDGNRFLYYGLVGTVSGVTSVDVFHGAGLDHGGANGQRTFWDGVGFEKIVIPEPSSSAIILGLFACALVRRRS